MGSTTNNVYTKQVAFSDKAAPNSAFKYLHPSSAFQPVQNGHNSPPQPIIQGKTDAATASKVSAQTAQTRDIKQPVHVQHHHHHYHHHHHHVHNMPQQKPANQDDLSSKNIAVEALQCGSSNMLSAPLEGKAGNQSMNGNGSGSNSGSNGQNGSITDLNARGTNTESDNGVVTGFATRSGIDTNNSAQREAALIKFRQKRKERCFEKKVSISLTTWHQKFIDSFLDVQLAAYFPIKKYIVENFNIFQTNLIHDTVQFYLKVFTPQNML